MLGYDLKNLLIVLLKRLIIKSLIDFLQKMFKKKSCILHSTFKIISKNSYFWKFLKKYIVYIKILLNIYSE